VNRRDLEHSMALLDADIARRKLDGLTPPLTAAASLAIADLVNLQAISPPEFSDDALALEFVERGIGEFRWSPGLGWMTDDGVVWSQDDKLRRYDLQRRICRQASNHADSNTEAKRIAWARSVNAALTLAQTDQRLVVPSEAWDRDTMLLNTPGGIVDLRTGQLRPRGAEYVTQVARVAPVNAPCPTWERFVCEVFCSDRDLIEFMQRALGYCLTGDRREQVLFFWYGLGANGKSVLAELLQWIAGSYAVKLPATALMQSRGERHPTELAQLRGKRVAVSSELDESSFFNESLVKELTGDATLTARFMRADFFEFQMTQKHVIVGNFKPRLRGGDPAMARRMVLVPFMASFKGAARDSQMLEKLKAEASGILHWLVRGAMAWASDGLAVPPVVRDASADYMADHDDLALWLDECCEREGEERANLLYESFSRWKKARGEHAPSLTVWGARLASVPGVEKRRSNGIRYIGLALTAIERAGLNDVR
jgi:putative DNA primase/helicase